VCGIDIGRAGLVATIRVPSDKDPARRGRDTRLRYACDHLNWPAGQFFFADLGSI
jgi:hypothetical protein